MSFLECDDEGQYKNSFAQVRIKGSDKQNIKDIAHKYT